MIPCVVLDSRRELPSQSGCQGDPQKVGPPSFPRSILLGTLPDLYATSTVDPIFARHAAQSDSVYCGNGSGTGVLVAQLKYSNAPNSALGRRFG